MFSVIIPLYNKEMYIERCIQSVLNQTYKSFEIIVVDDGSSDKSVELIHKAFSNIRIINQQNQGVSVARNTGIQLAKHEYIAFLDADDYWHPNYLKSLFNIISDNEDVFIIGGHYTNKKDQLEKIELEKPLNYFKVKNYFKKAIKNTIYLTSATCVKREFFQQNSHFNKKLKSGEDLDVWFRILLTEKNAFYIKNTFVYYSNEDINQTTRSLTPLEYSLVGNVFDIYHSLLSTNTEFAEFIDKYVYFNLYPYFFSQKYKKDARDIFLQIKNKKLLLDIIYLMPSWMDQWLLKKQHWLRKYMKFLFRKIYG